MQKKAFNRFQHHFQIKSVSKLKIEENFLNLIKSIFKKPTAGVIHTD